MAYGQILQVPRDLHPAARQAEALVDSRQRLGAQERNAPEPVHIVGAPGEVPFDSGWRHYDTGSSTPGSGTSRNVGFYKDRGRVYLQGLAGGGVSTGTLIFTLPLGYRPTAERGFSVAASISGGSGITAQWLLVLPNGGVYGNGLVDRAYVFLDTVSFRV